MRAVIVALIVMFSISFFINDAEARSPRVNKAKAQTMANQTAKAQQKSSLQNRVDNVKRMFTGGRGVSSVKKPLEVRGQSRNLSMMLVLKNSKDKIEFVNVRENFEKEILNTSY